MTPGRIVSVVDLDNMLPGLGRKAPTRRRQIVRQFLEGPHGCDHVQERETCESQLGRKFEARNPNFETNRNDPKGQKIPNPIHFPFRFLDFGFEFSFVSDFELRILALIRY